MENKEQQISNSANQNAGCTTALEDSQTSASTTGQVAEPKKSNRFSRRNLIRGGIAAAIVGAGGAMALPNAGSASGAEESATKQDIATLEQELSLLTKAASDSEVVSHKTYTIDENSTDTQYPSAKTVKDALTDKVDVNQGEAKAGYILIVNSSGKLVAERFTDDDLNETSTRPVQNQAIYKVVKELKAALKDTDSYPTEGSTKGVMSGGVYESYQTTFDIDNFETYKRGEQNLSLTPGMVYKYTDTGKLISDAASAVFTVIKLGDALIAISQADPSAIYVSKDNGANWALPYGGW